MEITLDDHNQAYVVKEALLREAKRLRKQMGNVTSYSTRVRLQDDANQLVIVANRVHDRIEYARKKGE